VRAPLAAASARAATSPPATTAAPPSRTAAARKAAGRERAARDVKLSDFVQTERKGEEPSWRWSLAPTASGYVLLFSLCFGLASLYSGIVLAVEWPGPAHAANLLLLLVLVKKWSSMAARQGAKARLGIEDDRLVYEVQRAYGRPRRDVVPLADVDSIAWPGRSP